MNPCVRTLVRLLPVVVVAVIAYCWTHRPPSSDAFPPASRETQRWIKLLRSSYVEKRQEAAEALAAMGADARPAAAALVAALGDKNSKVQEAAEKAVKNIGDPAVPALVVALTNESRAHQFAAARMLSEVDPTNLAGLPILIERLASDEFPVQRAAEVAVKRIGKPAIPALVAALTHKYRRMRFVAARQLSELDPRNPVGIPGLLDGLKQEEYRSDAFTLLVRQGAAAVPLLIEALKDPWPAVRADAAHILQEIGPPAAPAVAALAKALEDEVPTVRFSAARALAAIGPAAKDALPALVACFTDNDLPLRQLAIEAVVQFGPGSVPALMNTLTHPDPIRRSMACRALILLGSHAKPAIGALREMLRDEDQTVRWDAARALAPLESDERVVAILTQAMSDESYRDHAIRGLCQGGEAGRAVLIAALKNPDVEVRGETARALGRIGVAAKDTIPALIETLKDPDQTVRREAAHTLGCIPANTALSVPALMVVLNDNWSVNRSEAAIALSRLGPLAKDAAFALIANLADEDESVSQEAKKALVEIGPAALPALRGAANGDDDVASRAAADAVELIRINSKKRTER